MSDMSITGTCRRFYEQFQFPGNRPIDRDGLIFLRRFTTSVKDHSRRKNGPKLRVLDAGCGTGNTSVSLARRFEDVEFFGVDHSRNSLKKAIASARRPLLTNLHYRTWNLMDPLPFQNPFDIILCLGVLHHTANMKKGLINLHASLKNDGELYLWIYGKHGRYYHSLNKRLLTMLLNTKPSPVNMVELAKEFVYGANTGSALNDLLGKTETDTVKKTTLDDPVWIADQFLNPHEILLDMEELMDMMTACGFELLQLLGMDVDVSNYLHSKSLFERFNKLDSKRQLIALDLMAKPERYFVLLRKIDNRKKKK
jgi:SAM-dependent methyltransferase